MGSLRSHAVGAVGAVAAVGTRKNVVGGFDFDGVFDSPWNVYVCVILSCNGLKVDLC